MTEERLRVEPAPQQNITAATTPISTPATAPATEEPGKAEQVKDQAQEAAAPAKEKAREVAGQAKEHAEAAAGQAKDKAAAQVDERSTQVGRQISSQGDALQGVAGELRKQGKEGPAKVAEQAAEKVKDVGNYLEQADGEELVGAAQRVARENPAAAAVVGAAAGFAAGRVIKASLDDSDEESVPPAPDAATIDPGQPGPGVP